MNKQRGSGTITERTVELDVYSLVQPDPYV